MTEPYVRLGAEERRQLVDSMGGDTDYLLMMADDPENRFWRRVEEELARIFNAREADWVTRGNRDYLLARERYETSMPARRCAGMRPSQFEDTQANEVGRLTPKPISEQVAGAWNFIQPPPYLRDPH